MPVEKIKLRASRFSSLFFLKMFTDNLGCLQGVSRVVKKNYNSFPLILLRTLLTLLDNFV